MKRRAHAATSLAALAATVALLTPADARAIIDGVFDAQDHPNVASIGVMFPDGWGHACSGVLVAPRVVATSAHCTELWEVTGEPVRVTFDPEPGAGSETYGIVSMHTHPDWRSRFLIRGNSKCGAFGQCGEDVGAVVLDRRAAATPAALPMLDQFAEPGKQTFVAVGYGIQGFHPMFNPTGCCTRHRGTFSASKSNEIMSERFLKLLGEGTTAASFGDSGGPAFAGATSTVAGLFSIHQAWAEAPSYYYRLDTSRARAFLLSVIATTPA